MLLPRFLLSLCLPALVIRFVIAVVASAALLLAGCSSAPSSTEASTSTGASGVDSAMLVDAEPIAAESATLIVRGMSCPKCANNIDRQLMDVPGVRDVRIDMGRGEVKVQFASSAHPSPAELASAIERTGFTLDEIRTP
jgi:copper chaperone CopZ